MATGSSAEVEEERRLLYVAMTRAKDQLHLIIPQRFYTHGQRSTGDRHVYASRTRFIPDLLTSHFEIARWPVLVTGASAVDDRSKSSVDIRSRMRAMWG
jgi:DNA helicase-2/ATP-dependent DNA helicase PcrA